MRIRNFTFSLKVILLLYTLSLSAQSSSINIIGYGNCEKQEKIFFLRTGEAIGIDHLLFDLCDDKIHGVKVLDVDKAVITHEMFAKINYYDITNNFFDVDIFAYGSNQTIYKITRSSQNKAILRKYSINENANTQILADDYFLFYQTATGIQAIKKKSFYCNGVRLIDLQGNVIAKFDYDSFYYYIPLNYLSSAIYFLIFSIDELEILKKVFTIN